MEEQNLNVWANHVRNRYCRKHMCIYACAVVSVASMWPATLLLWSVFKCQSWVGFWEACLVLLFIVFPSINLLQSSLFFPSMQLHPELSTLVPYHFSVWSLAVPVSSDTEMVWITFQTSKCMWIRKVNLLLYKWLN